MSITVTFAEEERQAMLLALAKLANDRPGWNPFLTGIALKMDTPESFKRRQVEALRRPGWPHVPAGKPVMFERFKTFLHAPATRTSFKDTSPSDA